MGPLLSVTVAVAAALACVGCGPSHASIPSPPTDVQALAAQYDAPTGTVPAQAMTAVVALQQTLGTIDATALGDVVGDLLSAIERRVDDSGLPTDPLRTPKEHRPIISGSITFHRICKGWDDASTTPDPANGAIDVTVVFQAGVLQRIIWGTATSCRERVALAGGGTVHALFDGTITIYLEGPLESDSSKAAYLVAWDGTIGTEAASVPLTFDFRVVPPQIEVRIPVPDGSVIGSVGAAGVSLRGANGTFTCTLDTFTCVMSST